MTRAASRALDAFLIGADGNYHASVGRTSWALPFGVRIDQGFLLFDWTGPDRGRGFTTARAERSNLVDFVNLAGATDDEIASFAKVHGALGLCGHGLPKYHPHLRPTSDWPPDVCMVASEGPEADAESIDDWRRSAIYAEGLLRLARIPYETLGIGDQGYLNSVGDWIVLASVRPTLERGDGRVSVVLGNGTLFGAIAVQLMYVVAGGGPGLAFCTGCELWFSPTRAPAAGQRSFCGRCKKKAGSLASLDYRRRNREDPQRQKLDRGRRLAQQRIT